MKKILIIDDDKTFQKTMSDMLKTKGYDSISAVDGEEGLIKAISENPDLILLDIRMPKLDGMGFLQAINEKIGVKKIPILITSNLEGIDKISEGVAFGVKGYIIKSNETLGSIMKRVEENLNPNAKHEPEIIPVE